MNKEKSRMRMTIYSLRDAKIYQAILGALKRGVEVEIAFDAKFAKDQYEKKLMELEAKGAKVFIFRSPEKPHKYVTGIMHNKYVIFEKNIYGQTLLWSGSFNFTSSAHRLNQENAFVHNGKYLITSFADDFKNLKTKFCFPYVLNGDSDYDDSKNCKKNEKHGLIKNRLRSAGAILGKRKRDVFESQDQLTEINLLAPAQKKRRVNNLVPNGIAKNIVVANTITRAQRGRLLDEQARI